GVGLTLSGLALIDTANGRYEDAEGNLAEARDLFRRAGDRWGFASSLWRTADLALARGDVAAADAALREARVVLGVTTRERWIAETDAGLAETAVRLGDAERAAELFAAARARYEASGDAESVAYLDERMKQVAKPRQMSRKDRGGDTSAV